MAGNLVLSRKINESIIIRNPDNEVIAEIIIGDVRGHNVKLLVKGRPDYQVNRKEVDAARQTKSITCPHCHMRFEAQRFVPRHAMVRDFVTLVPVCPGAGQDPLEVRQARDLRDVIEKGEL